jgi:RimJ/RimL family protein N-acetyltransferase
MNETAGNSFPEQKTGRLRLRQLALSDVPSLLRYAHKPRIAEQILNIPFPYKKVDAYTDCILCFGVIESRDRST